MRHSERGMSLLILVGVILSMGLLGGMGAITAKWYLDGKAQDETMAKLRKIAAAINSEIASQPEAKRSYVQDVGDAPSELDDLLTKPAAVSACALNTTTQKLSGWCGPYWIKSFTAEDPWTDAWGRQIEYSLTTHTLTSRGPDRALSTSDDIVLDIPGSIVTDGLVLNLDAAQGNGTSFPGAGCGVTSFTDISGSGLSGALTGFSSCGGSSGWLGDGTTGDPYRLKFDGTDDYVQLANTGVLNPTSITLEAWVKLADTVNRPIIHKWGGGWGYTLEIYNTRPTIVINSVATGVQYPHAAPVATTGQWMHLVGTYDAAGTGALQIYLNGAHQHGVHTTGNINADTGVLRVGARSDGPGEFNDSIAKIAIYNRPLTQAEISRNCNALKARFSGVTCS